MLDYALQIDGGNNNQPVNTNNTWIKNMKLLQLYTRTTIILLTIFCILSESLFVYYYMKNNLVCLVITISLLFNMIMSTRLLLSYYGKAIYYNYLIILSTTIWLIIKSKQEYDVNKENKMIILTLNFSLGAILIFFFVFKDIYYTYAKITDEQLKMLKKGWEP